MRTVVIRYGTYYKTAIVMFLVTVMGRLTFSRQDTSGLTQQFGLFGTQNIYQMLTLSMVVLLLLFCILFERRRTSALSFAADHALFLAILGLFLVSSIANRSGAGGAVNYYKSLYFLSEWLVVYAAVHFAYRLIVRSGSSIEDTFVILVKIASATYVSVVILVALSGSGLAFDSGGRLGGFVVHPNKFAVVSIIGGVTFLLYGNNRSSRVIGFLFLLVALATLSRSVLVSGVFAVFIAIIFSRRKTTDTLMLFFLQCFLAITAAWGVSFFLDQFLLLFLRGGTIESVFTASNRTLIWDVALRLVADNPWLGLGYDFGPDRLSSHYGLGMKMSWMRAANAHNDVLNAALSGGILAGALLAALYLRLFRSTVSSYTGRFRFLLITIVVVLVGHSVFTPILSARVASTGVFLAIFLNLFAAKRSVLASMKKS